LWGGGSDSFQSSPRSLSLRRAHSPGSQQVVPWQEKAWQQGHDGRPQSLALQSGPGRGSVQVSPSPQINFPPDPECHSPQPISIPTKRGPRIGAEQGRVVARKMGRGWPQGLVADRGQEGARGRGPTRRVFPAAATAAARRRLEREGRRFGAEGAGRAGRRWRGGGAGRRASGRLQLPPASRGLQAAGGRSAERSIAEPREAARAPAPAPDPAPAPARSERHRIAPRVPGHRRRRELLPAPSKLRARSARGKFTPAAAGGVGAGSGRLWKVGLAPCPPCAPCAPPPRPVRRSVRSPGECAARGAGGTGIPGRAGQVLLQLASGAGRGGGRARSNLPQRAQGRGLRPGQVQRPIRAVRSRRGSEGLRGSRGGRCDFKIWGLAHGCTRWEGVRAPRHPLGGQ
jgi:hypothetical protein